MTTQDRFEGELSQFFDLSLDLLCITDFDFKILKINPAITKIGDYEINEVMGRSAFDLVHSDDKKKLSEALEDVLRKGRDLKELEVRYRRKDGSYVWTAWTSKPVLEKKLLYCIGRDITERKKMEEVLRENEERYHVLFESMDEGFASCEMIYDEKGKPVDFRYLVVNPGFTRLTGLAVDRVVGRRVTEAIPGIEPFWIDTYARVVQTGKSARLESSVSSLGKFYEVYAWRQSAGRFAVLFNDATDRKKAAMELKIKYEELEKHNRLMMGREKRIIELKKEVDEVLKESGQPARYKV